jgi:hypothetical protein
MSQFSESVCAFVALQFRDMVLWWGIILGCPVFRYEKTDSRRKNIRRRTDEKLSIIQKGAEKNFV